MNLNRRAVLGGAAALALLPATSAPAVTTAIESVVAPATIALPDLKPWWGYSSGEELWQGPFDSREQAIAAAIEDEWLDHDTEVVTGLCHPRSLHHPDYRDTIVEWLCCEEREVTLAVALNESFQGTNMESDFEGEVEEEGARVDWVSLADEFAKLLDDAIARSGFFLWEAVRSGMFTGDEAILSVLEKDGTFAAALKAAAHRWSDGNDLLLCSRMVDLTDEEPLPSLAAS